MASNTTSGPQEQAPMPSVDLRRMIGQLILTEGVVGVNDLKASQRAAGANMSVDVAAGQAYIKDDHASSNAGGYYAATWSAIENVTISASHASLPRIDRVVLRIRDAYLGDAANAIDLFVVTGTPTAGATLANLNGAGAVPGSSLLLANVLVDATVTSIVDAKIDSASSVRAQFTLAGAIAAGQELAYAEFTSDVTISATTEGTANTIVTAGAVTADGSTKMLIEFFCSRAVPAAAASELMLWLYEDGSSIGRLANHGNSGTDDRHVPYAWRRMTPASGSRTYSVRGSRNTGNWTMTAGAGGAATAMPGCVRITRAV